MKRILRIPTNEQYSYIELELGDGEELTPEAISSTIDDYHRATDAIRGQEGITEAELNSVIDKMILGATVEDGVNIYARMSTQQKHTVQTLKRALNRSKTRANKDLKENSTTLNNLE